MTRDTLRQLISDDWKDEPFMERVEFPKIFSVHFVVYDILGRGVSSSTLLDSWGKGCADFIRDGWVNVPVKFLRD